jgi:hypothetical protein
VELHSKLYSMETLERDACKKSMVVLSRDEMLISMNFKLQKYAV